MVMIATQSSCNTNLAQRSGLRLDHHCAAARENERERPDRLRSERVAERHSLLRGHYETAFASP
jgi:hypothetical protein